MSLTGEKAAEAYQTTCEVCNKTIQTKDPKQCEVCRNSFHTRCMTFRSVLTKGVQTFSCATCADLSSRARLDVSLNASAMQRNVKKKKSTSAPSSTSTSRSQSPVRPPPTSATGKRDVTLQDIFAAIKDVRERQDEAAESLRITNTKITGLEARLSLLEHRLLALDDLPLLQTRITNAEQTISELRAQVEDLSSRPPPAQPPLNTTPDNGSPATIIPSEIANLRRELLKIRQQQGNTNNNVVVLTGLRYSRETSIDLLAYSVVSALDPTVLKRDIAGARIMGRLNAAADTQAADSKLPPIAVTLSSHALARSTIRAKIKKGKLHTTELDANILEEAKAPRHEGLINVNELLSPEAHKLRVRARQEARRRNGCRSYVRDGTIYIRSTEDQDRATTINSEEDLDAFLARRPPPNRNINTNNG